MTLDIPSAGSPILDTWGAAVATKLNSIIPLALLADQSTNSGSAVDMDDMLIPAIAGCVYNFQLAGTYSVSATNQGLQLGFSGPGGSGTMGCRIWGKTSPTSIDRVR